MSDMMMQGCGIGMMVMGGFAALLGVVLLGGLMMLAWVAIGRLRLDPASSLTGR